MKPNRLVIVAVMLAACGGQTAATTTTVGPGTITAPSPAPTTTEAPASSTTTPPSTATTLPAAPTLPPSPIGDGESICDLYGAPVEIGQVSDIGLIEISGIAASRNHPGVIWAVNDSGDGPTIYAIEDGETISTVGLNGVFPIDFEDLDIGPGPDGTDHARGFLILEAPRHD